MTKAKLIKEIKKRMERIAKERDALRELLQDVESVIDSSDTAYRELERAVDRLSEYL
jgi:RNase adaptor protein for sRNA GlmZ degradation